MPIFRALAREENGHGAADAAVAAGDDRAFSRRASRHPGGADASRAPDPSLCSWAGMLCCCLGRDRLLIAHRASPSFGHRGSTPAIFAGSVNDLVFHLGPGQHW